MNPVVLSLICGAAFGVLAVALIILAVGVAGGAIIGLIAGNAT